MWAGRVGVEVVNTEPNSPYAREIGIKIEDKIFGGIPHVTTIVVSNRFSLGGNNFQFGPFFWQFI